MKQIAIFSGLPILLGKMKFVLVFLFLLNNYSEAQVNLKLLKDINTKTTPNASPAFVGAINNKAFFISQDPVLGEQLYVVENNTNPLLISDFKDGTKNESPRNFTTVGNHLFFTYRSYLWKSDGTKQGTKQIKNIDDNSYFFGFTNVNGILMFITSFLGDYVIEGGLWRSDGTEAGTYQVGPPNVKFSQNTVVYNGEIYLIGAQSDESSELWKSNGTKEGTKVVKDLLPAKRVSSTQPMFTVFNNKLYFLTKDIYSPIKLWRTDGTTQGTIEVTGVMQKLNERSISRMFYFNNALYLIDTDSKFWRTDGTASNTVFIRSFSVHASQLNSFSIANSKLFFVKTIFGDNVELWATDGTADGTLLIKSFSSGINSYLVSASNNVFFIANNRKEIWKSDGSTANTIKVFSATDLTTSQDSDINLLYTFDFGITFETRDLNKGLALWKSDGTFSGTKQIVYFDPLSDDSIGGTSFIFSLNGYHYFYASGGLWRTNGENITELFFKGEVDLVPELVNNYFMFIGNDGIHGRELWRSDGTKEGTKIVKEIVSGSDGFSEYHLSNVWNNQLIFSSVDPINGHSIWVSDGTSEGTILVKENIFNNGGTPFFHSLNSKTESSYFLFFTIDKNGQTIWKKGNGDNEAIFLKSFNGYWIINLLYVKNNVAYFEISDTNRLTKNELWVTDGTESGTRLVKNFPIGANFWGAINHFIEFRGVLYFMARETSAGFTIWSTDGSESGTKLVFNPNSVGDSYGGDTYEFKKVNDKLFFWVYRHSNPIHKFQLWVMDGLSPPIKLGDFVYAWEFWLNFKDELIFEASDSLHGVELWKSNGTKEGTIMIKDITPGQESSILSMPVKYSDSFYFLAKDNSRGRPQIWKSDGTPCGTQAMTAEIGRINSMFLLDDRRMFVDYTSAKYGTEPFIYERSDDPESGCITGLDELPSQSIYPNPFTDILHIKAESGSLIEIYDTSGRLAFQGLHSDGEINLSAFPSGIYVLSISSSGENQKLRIIKK